MKPILTAITLLALAHVATAETRRIQLKQEFTPKLENGAGSIWIPIPMDLAGYQKILKQEVTGNAVTAVERIGERGVPALRAEWKNATAPVLTIVTEVEIQDRATTPAKAAEVAEYLKPTKHVQTDGIVRETALKAVGKAKGNDAKAAAIYDWIVENSVRDPNVRGCGLGDVKTTLQAGNLSGKCADLNSLFVGLARAAGVPARETFGLRVDVSRDSAALGKPGDVSKSQHCRAEYWSEKKQAWVPVDPADVRKVVLEEKKDLRDPHVVKMRDKLFGGWEGNWVAFNHGRDFEIVEGGEKIHVNYFMYPTLVAGKHRPDGMDPKEVSYQLTSTVLR